jgi:hypothetical protein
MSASALKPTTPLAQAPRAVSSKEASNPVTVRARMSVGEYEASSYFTADNPYFSFRVFCGVVLILFCSVFSIPWSLATHPPVIVWSLRLDTLLEVVHFIASWGALPIFLLVFTAVRYARHALAEFGVNLAIAQHVEHSANAKVLAIRSNPKLRSSVANLQSEHLPDNPSNPKPGAYRLFQRICAEAQDRRFESTINLVEPYQRESVEPVLKLEGVQKIALRWGILCHFIGLVLVINSVPAMLASARGHSSDHPAQAIAALGSPAESSSGSMETEGPIDKIIDGLRLAFGASVGGLAVSLFAAWMLAQVRRKQFAYFRKLDEATSTMISLATNSLNNDELLNSLSQVTRRLEEQTVVVNDGIRIVAEAIGGQAKTIDQALRSLGDGKTKLDEFLKGVSEANQEFLKKLNTYYDVGTIAGVATQIKVHIDSLQSQTVNQLGSEVRDLKRFLGSIQSTDSRPFEGTMLRYVPYLLMAIAAAAVSILVTLLVR